MRPRRRVTQNDHNMWSLKVAVCFLCLLCYAILYSARCYLDPSIRPALPYLAILLQPTTRIFCTLLLHEYIRISYVQSTDTKSQHTCNHPLQLPAEGDRSSLG
jgi:predicted small integral membrane protein